MKMKVMAVAVAGVLAAPVAFAQSSNVQIYGRVNVGLDQWEGKGATGGSGFDYKSRPRVLDGSSRLGVRGSEDLGGGLKFIFLMEAGVAVDSGSNINQNGTASSSIGFWGSRVAFGGFDGSFGRLTLGKQNVWWTNGPWAQHGANFVDTEVPWNTGGMGRLGAPTTRTPNTVQYVTPNLGGFTLKASYSPQSEAVTSAATFSGSPPDTNGRIFGLTGSFRTGPFYGQVDWASNKAAGSSGRENTGLKIGGGWAYAPGANIGVVWVSLQNKKIAGGQVFIDSTGAAMTIANAGDDLKESGWIINWDHTFGNIQLLAEYGQLGNITGCTSTIGCGNDSKADGYMLGIRYLMSKRTAVYATYNSVTNKQYQRVDYFGGGHAGSIGSNIDVGIDPKIIGVGLIHNF